jgi:hypothetical protein
MKLCTIPECTGKHVARGLCSRHYRRWEKHGDPLSGRTKEGEVPEWLQSHAAYQGDDCLEFPYARKPSGYGALKFEGRIMAASRAMCILAHGHPASEELVAAHSCGNGHLGCVNPKHLRWATALENAQDLVKHREMGIRPLQSGVDMDRVTDIMRVRGLEPQKVTAARHGISASMVCRIQRGNRRQGLAS